MAMKGSRSMLCKKPSGPKVTKHPAGHILTLIIPSTFSLVKYIIALPKGSSLAGDAGLPIACPPGRWRAGRLAEVYLLLAGIYFSSPVATVPERKSKRAHFALFILCNRGFSVARIRGF